VLEREGGIRYEEVVMGGEESYELLHHLLRLKSTQRAQAGKVADFLDETALAFYRRQTELGAEGRLATLTFAGRPIAGMYDIVRGNRRYSAVLAYDAEYSRYSPGLVLEANVVCGWLDSQTDGEYNFGWGDDAYKYHWKPTDRPLTTFVDRGLGGLAALSGMRLRTAFKRALQGVK